jgi:hypothetical protein
VLTSVCCQRRAMPHRQIITGPYDVTMATTDTTIAHIMDEQDDIKIKSSKCWNPIWPPATLLTSNGRRIFIRHPFLTREYLMESSRSPLSNGSSLITKCLHSRAQLMEQVAASPVIGLWACNFVWEPGPSGAHVGCALTRWSTTLGTPRSSSHLLK